MTWLHHHKFVPVRDLVLAQFVSRQASFFSQLRPVVFICGAVQSPVRERVAEYLRTQHPKLLIFYADDVWKQISATPGLNALEMEEELAGLSDLLVIVVESPGTFAELGAFALSKELRKKILPILDRQYEYDSSFLNTGPVRWIDDESQYAPAIWTSHSKVLECAASLDDRVRRVSQRSSARVDNVAQSPKHLLFHVCDLVSVFGPTPLEHVEFFLSKTLRDAPATKVGSLMALAQAARLIRRFEVPGLGAFYFRPLERGQQITFQRKHNLFVPRMRMQVLSVVQAIPDARRAMDEMSGSHGTPRTAI